MMFTLGNWIFISIWTLTTIVVTCLLCAEEWYYGVINLLVSMFILLLICFGIRWYNTNTVSGIRAVKDYQSELSNGIDREITITAEDGREIFHYEGKVDVESNHSDNYIKFESEEGKRYIIYYGIQDTIKIIEK